MLSIISRRTLITNRVVAMRMYSEGASGDAFSKREAAHENLYVKKHEAEQLAALKEKLAEQEREISQTKSKLNDLQKK